MKDVPNIAAQHRTDQLVGLRLSLMLDTFRMSRRRWSESLQSKMERWTTIARVNFG